MGGCTYSGTWEQFQLRAERGGGFRGGSCTKCGPRSAVWVIPLGAAGEPPQNSRAGEEDWCGVESLSEGQGRLKRVLGEDLGRIVTPVIRRGFSLCGGWVGLGVYTELEEDHPLLNLTFVGNWMDTTAVYPRTLSCCYAILLVRSGAGSIFLWLWGNVLEDTVGSFLSFWLHLGSREGVLSLDLRSCTPGLA